MTGQGMMSRFRFLAMAMPWWAWLFWAVISSLLAALSIILADFVGSGSVNIQRLYHSAWFAIATGFLAFILCQIAVSRIERMRRSLLPFYDALTRTDFTISLIFGLAVALVSSAFHHRGSALFLTDPGGFFILITGVVGLAGVYLTCASVLDFRQTFKTFEDFSQRLVAVVQQVPANGTIKILAQTPAVGSLALSEHDWSTIDTALRAKSRQIQLVCLDEDSLRVYYENFFRRATPQGPVDQNRIERAIDQHATSLIEAIVAGGHAESRTARRIRRRHASEMPGYYLITNGLRALVAAPVFMPPPDLDVPRGIVESLPPVQTFGFDTSERDVVSRFEQMFDVYFHEHLPDPSGGSGGPTHSSDLTATVRASATTAVPTPYAPAPDGNTSTEGVDAPAANPVPDSGVATLPPLNAPEVAATATMAPEPPTKR
jgi:hypothetical protein